MRVYFQNYKNNLGVSIHKPLEGGFEQIREIFLSLPEDDGSYIGLVTDSSVSIQFSKFNKFVWLVEIPIPKKRGAYQIYLPKPKCISIMQSLCKGLNPLRINGLKFEPYT